MSNTVKTRTLTANLPDGCAIVITLVQPRGVSDAAFQDHIRDAEDTLRDLHRSTAREPHPAPAAPAAAEDPSLESQPESSDREARADRPEPVQIPASGRKLFVGNLPFDWTEELLSAHFVEAGTVTASAIARFRGRGRSRGFGFVEMSSEAEALAAIEKHHGSQAGGRKIVVRLAKSQESRPDTEGAPAEPADAAAPPKEAPAEDRPEPGNERFPRRAPRPSSGPRSSAGGRPRRGGGRPPARGPRPDRPPRQEIGITNKGGYEIFPRRAKGDTTPPPPEPRQTSQRSPIEASPYFEDTGDFENRGNRPPRRRRR